ncbi:MAG: hypothetical protein ACYC5N_04495 [Endomicrobiales bacterium]
MENPSTDQPGVGTGSLNSEFQFTAYKVDTLQLNMQKNIKLVEAYVSPNSVWDYKIQFRQPCYYSATKQYLGGMDIGLFLYPTKDMKPEEKVPEKVLISIQAGIAGLFVNKSGSGDRFEKDAEEAFVKYNLPLILLPYLRGAVTTALATAGFGSVLFPLINVQQMAKDLIKDTEIKVIE